MSAAIFIVVTTIAAVQLILITVVVMVALFSKNKGRRKTAVKILQIMQPAKLMRRW